jgi:hypothetical protein
MSQKAKAGRAPQGTAMSAIDRREHYVAQNGCDRERVPAITPRQRRRIEHKAGHRLNLVNLAHDQAQVLPVETETEEDIAA